MSDEKWFHVVIRDACEHTIHDETAEKLIAHVEQQAQRIEELQAERDEAREEATRWRNQWRNAFMPNLMPPVPWDV